MPTAVPQLCIAASTLDLSALELETARSATAPAACATRRRAQQRHPNDDFTYVLVDCPPSLNLLTVNAMAAANTFSFRCNANSSRSKVCRS